MRWVAAIALLIFGAATAGAEPIPAPVLPDPVAYRVSPIFEGDRLTALEVRIRFQEGPSGHTRLAWAKTGDDDRLWRFARGMKIEGGEAKADGPGAWVIQAAPGTPITATYRVISAYDGDPTDSYIHQTWPVIRPNWFYALGEGVFATPEDHDKSPATFEWAGAPRGFGFASDLEHLAGPGRPAIRAGTVDDISDSVMIGGPDLRIIEKRVDHARLRVAIVGRYEFSDRDFAAKVFEVLKAERAFWKEDAKPYLVAMSSIPSVDRRLSMSGRGRSDAFALWADPSSREADLRWLLAHEYFHTWNPILLGSAPEGPTEPLGFWFSEGFTDYYAWKLMLASGQFKPTDFATRWNETLAHYSTSPLKSAPNTVVMTNFWVSQAAQSLPYMRGAILAATLDAEARGRGFSLDAVMHEMRRMAAVKGEARHATELFPVAYEAVTGVDPRPLIQKHMIDGDFIELPNGALGPCFDIRAVQIPDFDRGWDADATRAADMTLAGVKPSSPAYAAGLRDGMKVLEIIAAEPGDSTRPYVLKVKPPGEADQVISYLPAGTGVTSRQAVAPVAGPGCPTPPRA